jgi:cytoskeletal protein CcmA (bactofilin family)
VFGRGNQDQNPLSQFPSAANGDAPPVPASAPVTAETTPKGTESVIGDDLAILGERITVIARRRVKVNGTIEGDINGKEVIIGPQGRVVGTVTANHIEVEGAIQGALRGASVVLTSTARVDGDIYHQKLAISEGAQFDGRVRRPQDPSEITPNLDPQSFQQAASQS